MSEASWSLPDNQSLGFPSSAAASTDGSEAGEAPPVLDQVLEVSLQAVPENSVLDERVWMKGQRKFFAREVEKFPDPPSKLGEVNQENCHSRMNLVKSHCQIIATSALEDLVKQMNEADPQCAWGSMITEDGKILRYGLWVKACNIARLGHAEEAEKPEDQCKKVPTWGTLPCAFAERPANFKNEQGVSLEGQSKPGFAGPYGGTDHVSGKIFSCNLTGTPVHPLSILHKCAMCREFVSTATFTATCGHKFVPGCCMGSNDQVDKSHDNFGKYDKEEFKKVDPKYFAPMMKWPIEVPREDWASAAKAEYPTEVGPATEGFLVAVCDNCTFDHLKQWAATGSAENQKLKRKVAAMEQSAHEAATRHLQEIADFQITINKMAGKK